MDDDDYGTLRWFGESWDAPVNDPRAQISIPESEECVECHRYFYSDEQGVRIPSGAGFAYFHKNCFFDVIGVPHE